MEIYQKQTLNTNEYKRVVCLSMHSTLMILIICGVVVSCLGNHHSQQPSTYVPSSQAQECQGDEAEVYLRQENSDKERYEHLRRMYEGCEVVERSLVLVDFEDYPFEFLRDIKEIRGSLLLYWVNSKKVSLPNLQLIRGISLYTPSNDLQKSFSIYIESHPDLRPMHVYMPKLAEVSRGSIMVAPFDKFCYLNKIFWDDVINDPNSQIVPVDSHEQCGKCHHSCSFCWGGSRKDCQALRRTMCPKECKNRCSTYGICCHEECSAGCEGSRDVECKRCKNTYFDGRCMTECPKRWSYDRTTGTRVRNNNTGFNFQESCLSQCPKTTLMVKNSCVTECSKGYKVDFERGRCVYCGERCPKVCQGTGMGALNSLNFHLMKGCIVVKGNIFINQKTFEGSHAIKVEDLKVLEKVEIITGYLYIYDVTSSKSLSFLSKLSIVGGLNNYRKETLSVRNNHIEELSLVSLKQVVNGRLAIKNNPKLCMVDSVDWRGMVDGDEARVYVSNNKNATECEVEKQVCSNMCDPGAGCYGKGHDKCVKCAYFKYFYEKDGFHSDDDNDVEREASGIDDDDELPSNEDDGDENKNDNDGYNNEEEEKEKAKDEDKKVNDERDGFEDNDTTDKMSQKNTNHGEKRYSRNKRYSELKYENNENLDSFLKFTPKYYKTSLEPTSSLTTMQQKKRTQRDGRLHQPTQQTTSQSSKTPKNSKAQGKFVCLKDCVSWHSPLYQLDNSTCAPCHQQCLFGCYGPLDTDCLKCANFNQSNHCVDACSSGYIQFNGLCLFNSVQTAAYKTKPFFYRSAVTLAMIIVVVLILLMLIVLMLLRHKQKVADQLETKIKYESQLSGVVECEPLRESNVEPNMSKVRLLKESELERGCIIGSGAFGTVYKGSWTPSEKKDIRISVAIKILQPELTLEDEERNHSNSMSLDDYGYNKCADILEEAKIMASVSSPFCTSLLGVCVGRRIQLVSPFMPLGCLLDYLRLNKGNIDSKLMINWCLQIAKGMAYLGSKEIIHRDLAARNVLVQTPTHVRITDFGLAKLVQNVSGVYKSHGGKLPVKWLALESIREKVFTHKSDVWSFGITLWEIFTFGCTPYNQIPMHNLVSQLEKGERLPQPAICTIDVFMLLIKCWLVDSNARPSFKQLVDLFKHMASDPSRYVVIENSKLKRKLRSPLETSGNEVSYASTTNSTEFPDLPTPHNSPAIPSAPGYPTLNSTSSLPYQPIASFVPTFSRANESYLHMDSQQSGDQLDEDFQIFPRLNSVGSTKSHNKNPKNLRLKINNQDDNSNNENNNNNESNYGSNNNNRDENNDNKEKTSDRPRYTPDPTTTETSPLQHYLAKYAGDNYYLCRKELCKKKMMSLNNISTMAKQPPPKTSVSLAFDGGCGGEVGGLERGDEHRSTHNTASVSYEKEKEDYEDEEEEMYLDVMPQENEKDDEVVDNYSSFLSESFLRNSFTSHDHHMKSTKSASRNEDGYLQQDSFTLESPVHNKNDNNHNNNNNKYKKNNNKSFKSGCSNNGVSSDVPKTELTPLSESKFKCATNFQNPFYFKNLQYK